MLSGLAALGAQTLLLHLAQSTFATPLQLYTPTLIHPAFSNSTALPTNSFHSCFDPQPGRLTAKYRDCETATLEINKGKDKQRYIFGRGSLATYKLPKTFSSGTCVVNLDMVYNDQMDSLTILEIQEAAFDLALRCATGTTFNQGGVAAVGPSEVLYITILGTKSDYLPTSDGLGLPQRNRG